MLATTRLACPAKINLHLRVGLRRLDGFHPLSSWMCTVGLFDTLELTPADEVLSTGERSLISLTCDQPGLPCDDRNLIVRIAAGWAAETGAIGSFPLQARLIKRIPIGAGLGGGSSDAARMLSAVNHLWTTHRAVDALSAFAVRYGSDIPFFLHGPSSICTGQGEIVRPIARPRPAWAVLVLPEIMMPTAAVYRRFDEIGLGRKADVSYEPDWTQWTSLDAEPLLARLVNDLEAPAFAIRPELGHLRASIEQTVGRIVRMSGSGSSLFTMYDDPEAAATAAALIADRHHARAEWVAVAPPPNVPF